MYSICGISSLIKNFKFYKNPFFNSHSIKFSNLMYKILSNCSYRNDSYTITNSIFIKLYVKYLGHHKLDKPVSLEDFFSSQPKNLNNYKIYLENDGDKLYNLEFLKKFTGADKDAILSCAKYFNMQSMFGVGKYSVIVTPQLEKICNTALLVMLTKIFIIFDFCINNKILPCLYNTINSFVSDSIAKKLELDECISLYQEENIDADEYINLISEIYNKKKLVWKFFIGNTKNQIIEYGKQEPYLLTMVNNYNANGIIKNQNKLLDKILHEYLFLYDKINNLELNIGNDYIIHKLILPKNKMIKNDLLIEV